MEENDPSVLGGHAASLRASRPDAPHVPHGRDRPGREGIQGSGVLGQLDAAYQPGRPARVPPVVGKPTLGGQGRLASADGSGSEPTLADGCATRGALLSSPRSRASCNRVGRVQRPSPGGGLTTARPRPQPCLAQPEYARSRQGSPRREVPNDSDSAGRLCRVGRGYAWGDFNRANLPVPRAHGGPRCTAGSGASRTRSTGFRARSPAVVRSNCVPSRGLSCRPEVPLRTRVGRHDGSLHRAGRRFGPTRFDRLWGGYATLSPTRGCGGLALNARKPGPVSEVCRHSSVGRAADL